MYDTIAAIAPAVECRLGEIRGRRLENLVRPLQLAILAIQRRQPLALACRQARSTPRITLRLPHPLAQRFSGRPDLRRHGLWRHDRGHAA